MIISLLKWIGITLCAVCVFALLVVIGFDAWALIRENKSYSEAAPVNGRFVKAGDLQVFIQEKGPVNGPAVIFLHGMGAWSELWRENLDAVAESGFRAVAIDLPPFGYSEKPSNFLYKRSDQAARIVGVLDALSIDKAFFVGHSFGGGPTMEAVLTSPDRVRGLVLLDPALGLGQPNNDSGSGVLGALMSVKPIRYSATALSLANPLLTKKLLSLFVADASAVTAARIKVLQKPFEINGVTGAVSDWLYYFLTTNEKALSSDEALYRNLKIPVRLIWGREDTVTPLSQGEHIADLIPGADLKVIDGAGHMPQIENPEAFQGHLIEFLKAH